MQAAPSKEAAAVQVDSERQAPKIGRKAFRLLAKIGKAQQRQDYEAIEKRIAKALANKTFNGMERASFLRHRLWLPHIKFNPAKRIDIYKQILVYRNELPVEFEFMVLKGLAASRYDLGQYKVAIALNARSQELLPNRKLTVGDLLFLSKLNYALSDFKQSKHFIDAALAEARNEKVIFEKKPWYDFSVLVSLKLGRKDKAFTSLAASLEKWPSQMNNICAHLVWLNQAPTKNSLQANRFPKRCDPTIVPIEIDETSLLSRLQYFLKQSGGLQPITNPTPQYPRRANIRGIEGHAAVAFTIRRNGTVDLNSLRVIESVPKGVFDRAALTAAGEFRFQPQIINGEPAEIHDFTYLFTFDLRK